jgi:hypothetical protein
MTNAPKTPPSLGVWKYFAADDATVSVPVSVELIDDLLKDLEKIIVLARSILKHYKPNNYLNIPYSKTVLKKYVEMAKWIRAIAHAETYVRVEEASDVFDQPGDSKMDVIIRKVSSKASADPALSVLFISIVLLIATTVLGFCFPSP